MDEAPKKRQRTDDEILTQDDFSWTTIRNVGILIGVIILIKYLRKKN